MPRCEKISIIGTANNLIVGTANNLIVASVFVEQMVVLNVNAKQNLGFPSNFL